MLDNGTMRDYIVIGGGLGGLTAAYMLALSGRSVELIDHGLPEADGALGGFTKFSGAKFSLLPAGQGLVPVAGDVDALNIAIANALTFYGLKDRQGADNHAELTDRLLDQHTSIREYRSIVLTPQEISILLDNLTERVRRIVPIVNAEVVSIDRHSSGWVVNGTNGRITEGRAVLYAGGRAGGSLLRRAGATPQNGKGLDLGVRVEFVDKESIRRLRDRGPDAKILIGNTRIFCLNHPGTIYRYEYGDISIPGGIVADENMPSANFGILTRIGDKDKALKQVIVACPR